MSTDAQVLLVLLIYALVSFRLLNKKINPIQRETPKVDEMWAIPVFVTPWATKYENECWIKGCFRGKIMHYSNDGLYSTPVEDFMKTHIKVKEQ